MTPISLNTLAASMKISNNTSSSPSLLSIKQSLYQSPPLQPPSSLIQQQQSSSSSSYQVKKSLQDLLPPSNVSFPVTVYIYKYIYL